MVGNGACAKLRSLAVPLGGCRERLCEFFLWVRCARGGCKWLETELALIYVRSLCRWAVAANACVSFLLARCARGGGKWSETELALISVRPLCRWAVAPNACVIVSLARCARGGRKWLETELALIYVRSLCRGAVAAKACVSFLWVRCAVGRLQRVGNGARANLRSPAVGGCRERLWELFVGSLC